MALPTINTPTYELEVPSTGEKIKYRPFLVKEEKILLIAMESEDSTAITQAIKEICNDCTFNKLKLGDMPMFDVEYLFLNIRAKSVGEVSELTLRCPDDKETTVPVKINLTEIQVEVADDHTNKIELTDEMGVYMKYPSIDSFVDTGIVDVTPSNMLEIIAASISQIYDKKGEEVYEAKDSTKKELNDFLEQLNQKQFIEIQKFFDTMPKLKHVVTIENPKTKVKSDVILQGLGDFFG